MELCLIHNDPAQTLLVTPDGRPLYAIESPRHQAGNTTTIRRLMGPSTGHVESEVGKIEYHELHGTRMRLYAENIDILLRPSQLGMSDK